MFKVSIVMVRLLVTIILVNYKNNIFYIRRVCLYNENKIYFVCVV